MLLADQICTGCRLLGEAGGEKGMKLDPLVAEIESSIAIRSFPEEWCRLLWFAAFAIGWRLFHQRRYQWFAVVQKVRGKFKTDAHEVWGILGILTMCGVFVFEYMVDDIVVV